MTYWPGEEGGGDFSHFVQPFIIPPVLKKCQK